MKRIKLRGAWLRKPHTQVVPNKKALDKKYSCRRSKGSAGSEIKDDRH